MYTVYFIFLQVASATATNFGLSRGLLGLQYDKINASESESDDMLNMRLAPLRQAIQHSYSPFEFRDHSSEP